MTSRHFEALESRAKRLRKKRILQNVFLITLCSVVLFGLGYGVEYLFTESTQNVTPVAQEENSLIKPIDVIEEKQDNNATSLVASVEENSTNNEIVENEILFLAPQVYKKRTQLPANETQEAKRSLEEENNKLKKFQKNKNFSNAYSLASFYFERKAYSETIEWSRKASSYDSKSDKPWILYAKAKFYLGEKAEAIRSLELFLGYINSKEVEELLNFYKGQE